MIYRGVVSTVEGNLFRVNIDGNLSAPMNRLTSAFRETVDSQGIVAKEFPGIGDSVLCWFPGEALCGGCILGIEEG